MESIAKEKVKLNSHQIITIISQLLKRTNIYCIQQKMHTQ